MGDEPEVREGTRQPSGRIGADFHLNDGFVAAVGEEKAERFLQVLRETADAYPHHGREEIKAEISRRLDAIDVRVSDVELDSFADTISRSEGAVDPAEHDKPERRDD